VAEAVPLLAQLSLLKDQHLSKPAQQLQPLTHLQHLLRQLLRCNSKPLKDRAFLDRWLAQLREFAHLRLDWEDITS
jgi:hypothetical protein